MSSLTGNHCSVIADSFLQDMSHTFISVKTYAEMATVSLTTLDLTNLGHTCMHHFLHSSNDEEGMCAKRHSHMFDFSRSN